MEKAYITISARNCTKGARKKGLEFASLRFAALSSLLNLKGDEAVGGRGLILVMLGGFRQLLSIKLQERENIHV